MSDEVNNNENLNRSKNDTKGLNDDILSQDEKRIKFLEDIKTLVDDTNDDLSSNLSLQRNITEQLTQLKKDTVGYNEELKASINLSRQVEKAIKDSVNAGQNMDQIERSMIKNKNTQKQIIQQIKAISDLNGQTDQEILDNAIKFAEARQEMLSSANKEKEIRNEAQKLEDKINNNLSRNKDIQLEIQQLIKSKQNGSELENEIADRRIEKLQQEAMENENIISNSQKDLPTQLEKLAAQEEITKSKQEQFNISKDILPIEEEQAIALADSAANLDDVNERLKEELDILQNINDAMGLGGQAVSAMNKLFGGQLGFLKDVKSNTEKILRDRIEERKQHNLTQKAMIERGELTEEEAIMLDENVSKMEGFTVQIMEAGRALRENILDPVVLIGIALQYDKQLNQLSKRLGASESVIRRIRTDFRTMAAEIDRIGINTSNIASTADMLNQRLGTAFRPDTGRFKELIGDVAVLTELMGLSEEAANGFFRAAASSSQSVEDIKLESLGIITAVEQQSGVLLDNVAILESAGKVSGQIRAQLHDSIQEIVEAESAARKFGMTLQSVADAGNQLLNFEQSISNELEAELLLGRQLNLERARAAALAGDYATLAEEINANVGDFSDFQDLNVLQQRALADAVGMTVDGLSEQLMAKEDLAALAQEARAAGNEEKAQQLERLDTEQKFKKILQDIQAAFVDIAGGPIGDLVRFIADIAGFVSSIIKGLSGITGGFSDLIIQGVIFYKLMQGIVNTFFTMKALSKAIADFRTRTLATEVTKEGVNKGGLITDKTRAFFSKSILGTKIKEANAEFLSNTRKARGLVMTKLRDWWEKSVLGSKIGQTTQEGAQNVAKGAGNILTGIRSFLENTVLSTKIGQSIQELAINAYKVIGNILTGIRDFMEKSILGTLILHGVQYVFNIGKAIVLQAIAGARALLEGTVLGRMIAQAGIMLVQIARQGVLLALALGRAVAAGFSSAFKALGRIPVVGPFLAIAAAIGLAAVTIGAVASAFAAAPKKKLGGPIIGPAHEGGGVNINAEGGEFVVNKDAAASIGSKNLETINKGSLPVNTVNQQVVQNNKVMETKLDGVISALNTVANKTGNVRAFVVSNPTEIPDMGTYDTNFQNTSATGGPGNMTRGGF